MEYMKGLFKNWGFRHLPSSRRRYRIIMVVFFLVSGRILLVNSGDYDPTSKVGPKTSYK